jgi:hypothetical protein
MDAFGVVKLRAEAFRYLISLGRVLFILDGYDEMVEANPVSRRRTSLGSSGRQAPTAGSC